MTYWKNKTMISQLKMQIDDFCVLVEAVEGIKRFTF
jgi:hypothetical protein